MTSIETRPNNHRAASWTISLDYSERTVSPERAKLHKLAPQLPYHDIKPPPGVRVIRVEAFHVKMLLRNPIAANALQPVSCEQGHADSENEKTTFDEESLFGSMDVVDEGHLCPSDDVWDEDVEYMQSSTLHLDKLGQQINNTFAVESNCAYLTPPPSQETREERGQQSGTEAKQHSIHRVSTQTIMTSLETGLRHVMCKAPSRNPKAHTITSNEGFDCLPLIAPALWLPDYHKSLSERAVFLPTISHAIANVSAHSSTGLGLKVKAWQLCHRYPHTGRQDLSPGVDLGTNELQEALSVDLWAAMASGLGNTRTAKQSRPLRDLFESTHGADGFGDAEPMLDDVATDYGSDTTCDESEFEDLLDVASEADDRSVCNLDVSDTGDVYPMLWTDSTDLRVPTNRLPSHWNSEHPSRPDPYSDMFEDSTELYEGDPCGVQGFEDGGVGGDSGTHRRTSECWSDSEVLQTSETAGPERDADDMLLWDL